MKIFKPVLLNNEYKIIDLTHKITSSIPTWPSVPNLEILYTAKHETNGICVMQYNCSASLGTHIDAPYHFIDNAAKIGDLEINQLIAPACVIDISLSCENNFDYVLSVEDILKWEAQNGKIPEGCIFLVYTGWSKRWPDIERYRNMDQNGIMHFPGVSEKAAQLLLKYNIAGLGIDTFSPDAGIATDFPVHKILLGNNIILIENLKDLEKLPAIGALLIALPMNIAAGSEAPARVIAFV